MWSKKTKRSESKPLPTGPVNYLAGMAVRCPSGLFYINKDGKRYRILTDRVFDSWSFPLVITTSDAAVAHYPIAANKLPFRDGSLLNNIADGKLYLVSGGKLRHIISPDVLERFSLTRDMAIEVSDAEINIMRFGEVIY